MGRKASIEKKIGIYARLPSSLVYSVKTLLLDPRTGRVGYGRMAALVTQLLTEWVEAKRKGIPTIEPTIDHDAFEIFDGPTDPKELTDG